MPARAQRVRSIRVEHVSMRDNAVYHDFGSGLSDALVPDNLLIEAKLHEITARVTPDVLDVHVPSYGRRFWAFVETRPLSPELVRTLLNELLEFRRTKYVVLLDEGVDLHDARAVIETIGTRSQPGSGLHRSRRPCGLCFGSLAAAWDLDLREARNRRHLERRTASGGESGARRGPAVSVGAVRD